jgi:hypothetical protein
MSYPRPTIYGALYRWLMKLAHRYNWHHTRTCYPDGDTMVVCDWCGIRDVTHRRRQFGDYEPIQTSRSGSASEEKKCI